MAQRERWIVERFLRGLGQSAGNSDDSSRPAARMRLHRERRW
jgi:hypothetical protein